MTEPMVVVEQRDGFTWIWMNRPERRNALSLEHLQALRDAFVTVAESDARGIVLGGRGPVFSSGHDFRDVVDSDLAQVRALLDACVEVCVTMHAVPQPIVARVHGLATAAGFQLVASADLAVAGESAGFAVPGGKGGWFCHTPMVAVGRTVSRKHAFELALTGDTIDAATGLAWGVVNAVVPDDELDAAVVALLERATRGSVASKSLGKLVLHRQLNFDEVAAYALAVEAMADSSQYPDAREGMRAFIEKRPPVWADPA